MLFRSGFCYKLAFIAGIASQYGDYLHLLPVLFVILPVIVAFIIVVIVILLVVFVHRLIGTGLALFL